MKDETRQEISAAYAKDYTEWMVKTGGFARDMTMLDHLAGVALQGLLAYAATTGKYAPPDDELAREAYKLANAVIKEKTK